MFNVKHKTTRGIKASAAQSPCHFYPMQLLVGRNQTQILEGKSFRKKNSLEEDVNVFSAHKPGKQSVSHTQLWSIHLQVTGKRKDMGNTYQAEYQSALGCALSAWLKPTVKTHNQHSNPRGPLIFVSDYFALWETESQ